MAHIIDIILVAAVLLIVFISAKRGIIRTVFDLASGIIAFLGAKVLAPAVSVFLYDSFVKEIVLNFLNEKYSGIENAIADSVSSLTSVFDFLPAGVLTYMENSGMMDSQALSHSIMTSITTVEQLESSVAAPVITSLLQILSFAVLALVLLVVLRIASGFLSKLITKVKIADKLNTILGAVFGLLKGLVYIVIIASVVSIVSCSSETVAAYAADSYICSFVATFIGI